MDASLPFLSSIIVLRQTRDNEHCYNNGNISLFILPQPH